MTERDITGDAAKSAYRRAQKIAEKVGLSDDDMRALAEGVREFDAKRSAEERTASALEKLAEALTSQHRGGDGATGYGEFEERRLRRREVYAQELMAVAVMADIVDEEALADIRATPAFQRLVDRLRREPNASTPDSATP